MGIPAFYRWLVEKYPLAVVDVVEELPEVVNGVRVPVDTSKPNPNDREFDNLYLDMNGIIHPCFHPEGQDDQPAPKTYEEVFKAVFEYIDCIFAMVRPRKLLFMAIDGVAPRAKMNQQRARRFRAAKDATEAAAEEEKLKGVFRSEREKKFPLEQTSKLDSNIITPGTEFMASLSVALRYYIHLRLNKDPGWRDIKVILSDANVPGEGEHKVASYIRLQRNLPGFDPNTRHCLYGLDADLIMLALATHEVQFSILREDVRAQQYVKSTKPGKGNNFTARGKGRVEFNRDIGNDIPRQQFQFLNIWVLRDYLEHDMRMGNPTTEVDLERLVDDFVFMCLFVGNDFLPHVPSLEISEGAIDLLMTVYKKEFIRMGGHLTNSYKVDLERVEHFLQVVGSHENAIFRRRTQLHKEREIQQHGVNRVFSTLTHTEKKKMSESFWYSLKASKNHKASSKTVATKFQRSTKGICQTFSSGSASDIAIVDQIKLGEEGWKERYYAEKFEVKTEDDRNKLKRHAVMKYTEGICWVMHYYYQGVCSWQWFYPYHYAPFASDFHDLKQLEIHFTLGIPFKPFDQLMGVLPAASAHALPLFYSNLMTDPWSPISDFYPTDFELDMNGKRFTWQAVCKLPFIEESRLLVEIGKVEHTLTAEEKERNSSDMDTLFVHASHPFAAKIFSFHRRKREHPKLQKAKIKRKIDPACSAGMNGYMYISDKTAFSPEIYSPIGDMETIVENQTIFVFYRAPPFHTHVPRLPKGAILPGKSISKRDVLPSPVLWHEKSAVLGRILSERPVPRSISGQHLSKLSQQLVTKYYLEDKRKGATVELLDTVEGSPGRLEKTIKEKANNKRTRNGRSRKRKRGDADHNVRKVRRKTRKN